MPDSPHADAPPPYYPNPRYSKGSASSTDGKTLVDDKVLADDKAPVDDKFLADDKVSDDVEVSVDEESSLKSDYISQQAWAVLKQLGNLQENVLTQLKKYDTIVVLDDSGSMTSEHRWEDARESLAIFSRIITKYDDDGMDLHFLNRTGNNTKGIKRPEIVERLCQKRPHRDFGTDIGAALTKIVDPYLKKLEAAKADAIAEAAGIVEAAAIAKAAALARATPWVPAPAPTPTPAEVPVPEPVSAPVSAPEPEPVTVPVPAPIPITVKSSGFYTRMKSVFHRREIPGPAAPAPTIPARAAPARAIPAPTIPAPVILAPVIIAPSAPVIIAPTIPAPTIPAPTIPAPTIPAPVILAPAIPAPVIKPIFPKPLNIIVITDGHPTDEDVVVQIIRKAARATADLDEFPRIQIGFQFVQVGSSWSAKQWLEKLDDDKETLFARDIVDTRPYSGKALDVCLLLSVLIGAFEKNTDKADAEMWCEMREESDALPEKRR